MLSGLCRDRTDGNSNIDDFGVHLAMNGGSNLSENDLPQNQFNVGRGELVNLF